MRPWEWDLLTVEQADHLLDWLDDYQQQIDEARADIDN